MSVTPVVLGIDPQASRLGLALVEFEAPHRALWADTVSINLPHAGWLYQQVANALGAVEWDWDDDRKREGYEITRVGIEQPPYVNDMSVYRGICVVFGLVGAECHRRWPWAPQVSCGVGQWKKAVLGNGNAKKDAVMVWAREQRGLAFMDPEIEQDSADALAIATYAAGVELSEPAREAA